MADKKGGARGRAAARGRAIARGRGRGRGTAPRTPVELPPQYSFTPTTDASPPPLQPLIQTQLHVCDFPPPANLFNNTQEAGPSSNPQGHMSQQQTSLNRQPQTTPNPHPQTTPNPHPHPQTTSHPEPHMTHWRSSSNPSPTHVSQPTRFSPLHNSDSQSNQGSEGQQSNEFEDHGVDEIDDNACIEPNLPEAQLRFLERQLMMPNRDQFTTVLSPLFPQPPKTTWFGRDKSALVRKITKIFCNKFDQAYYSWSCVPRDRADRMFLEYAKTHTWDPLITGTVQAHFEAIFQRRMKDMVSKAHGSGLRPTWIVDKIWQEMCAYWDTEEGVQRSEIYSKARNSDRGGLGPFKTFTGQKSFLQIHQEMEEELGRPVSFGELFLKTHTKSDGTYVDSKAQQVAESYEKNLQAKLAEVDPETSDGTSRNQE